MKVNLFIAFIKKNVKLLIVEFISMLVVIFSTSLYLSSSSNENYSAYAKSYDNFSQVVETDSFYKIYRLHGYKEAFNNYNQYFGEGDWFLLGNEYDDYMILIDPQNRIDDDCFKASANLSLFSSSEETFSLSGQEISLKNDNGYISQDNLVLINYSTILKHLGSGACGNYIITVYLSEDNLKSFYNFALSDDDIFNDFVDTRGEYYSAGVFSALIFIIPLYIVLTLYFSYVFSLNNRTNYLLLLRLGEKRSKSLKSSLYLIISFCSLIFLFNLCFVFIAKEILKMSYMDINILNSLYISLVLVVVLGVSHYLWSYMSLTDKNLIENIRNDD